jgi:hypothetical protein
MDRALRCVDARSSPPRSALLLLGVATALLITAAILFRPGPRAPDISMHLVQYRLIDGQIRQVGEIGLNSSEARYLDDSIGIQVHLADEAYCYVLALNPDGGIQLCFPAGDKLPPPPRHVIEAPVLADGTPGLLALTDDVGAQGVVIVASTRPLPAYVEWIERVGPLPWQRCNTTAVWLSDGMRVTRGSGHRGDILEQPATAQPFVDCMNKLNDALGVESVRGILFPVRESRADPRRSE